MRNFAAYLALVLLVVSCTSSPQCDNNFSELPAPPTQEVFQETAKPEKGPVPSGNIRISYEVLRPGDYPWQPGMTVEKLVSAAGGFTGYASGIRVQRDGTNLVKRYYGSGIRTEASPFMRTPLEPGDTVWIMRRE
jgi:hypothetical protein